MEAKFEVNDRVRHPRNRGRSHYGTVVSRHPDNSTLIYVRWDGRDRLGAYPRKYREVELEFASPLHALASAASGGGELESVAE